MLFFFTKTRIQNCFRKQKIIFADHICDRNKKKKRTEQNYSIASGNVKRLNIENCIQYEKNCVDFCLVLQTQQTGVKRVNASGSLIRLYD